MTIAELLSKLQECKINRQYQDGLKVINENIEFIKANRNQESKFFQCQYYLAFFCFHTANFELYRRCVNTLARYMSKLPLNCQCELQFISASLEIHDKNYQAANDILNKIVALSGLPFEMKARAIMTQTQIHILQGNRIDAQQSLSALVIPTTLEKCKQTLYHFEKSMLEYCMTPNDVSFEIILKKFLETFKNSIPKKDGWIDFERFVNNLFLYMGRNIHDLTNISFVKTCLSLARQHYSDSINVNYYRKQILNIESILNSYGQLSILQSESAKIVDDSLPYFLSDPKERPRSYFIKSSAHRSTSPVDLPELQDDPQEDSDSEEELKSLWESSIDAYSPKRREIPWR